MFVQNFMAIHRTVVEIFQSGQKWWTDRLGLEKLFSDHHLARGSAKWLITVSIIVLCNKTSYEQTLLK